jgi:primosomal protein N' (replication factor Y)
MGADRAARSPLVSQWLSGQMVIADMGVSSGKRFYVDSGSATGADTGGYGRSPDAPKLTVDEPFTDQDVTADKVCQMGLGIKKILERWPKQGREIQVLGPVEAPITKLKGKYRWQILVKSKYAGLLHEFLDRVEGMARKSLRSSGVAMVVDVDPHQML